MIIIFLINFYRNTFQATKKKPNSLIIKILDNLDSINPKLDNGNKIVRLIRKIIINAMRTKLGITFDFIKNYIPESKTIVENNKYLRDELLLPILIEMKKMKIAKTIKN